MATKPKILIVDDEPFNLDYLEQELEDADCETLRAVNGQEALDQVRTDAPDLILLDIMMPVMDGFEVLRRLKANLATRDIPVIVISASTNLDSVVRGIQLGAEDYLPKPFEPVLLHARLGSSLEKKRLRDQLRKLLHTFATPEVADQLMETGFALGGKYVNATVMFADIRSFTTIVESHGPADTIELLNNYFPLMFEAIAAHGGTLNQMVGDGLMAVFGAPIPHGDHRERAVRAALDMMANLSLFNLQQAALNKVQIQIGIGIASGEMIAGYTGTQHRATYTCVGDTVNLAARIEAHTKLAGCPILVDENTRNGLPQNIGLDSLGPVLFKGKQQEVNIFAVNM